MLKRETVAFLKNWLAWVERGAPDGRPYSRKEGLCVNVHWRTPRKVAYLVLDDLYFALGSKLYPFGRHEYWSRVKDQTQHECPKRLAWVREQIAASEGGYDNE